MIIIKKKKAFSMITAIFVIVIMATVTALIMNVTGKTLKATTQQYQKEQAGLLARSYTELAIMYVMHYDRTLDCLESISDHFGAAGDNGYDIQININYIGNDTLLANCTQSIDIDGDLGNTTTWVDDTSTGFNNTISLVIDTYITYKDFDDLTSNRNITFHRRTLQKL
jgi:type II secretory pathway pseudopilin PulG